MSGGGDDAVEAGSRISRQIPAFAAIGLIGYVVDAGITYLGAKYLGLSPEIARPPGFLIATMVNFALNRAITFRHAKAPLVRAFLRYCLVAAGGSGGQLRRLFALRRPLAARSASSVTPAILPLFVAAGSGVAMVVTFVGFRWFAFRP